MTTITIIRHIIRETPLRRAVRVHIYIGIKLFYRQPCVVGWGGEWICIYYVTRGNYESVFYSNKILRIIDYVLISYKGEL